MAKDIAFFSYASAILLRIVYSIHFPLITWNTCSFSAYFLSFIHRLAINPFQMNSLQRLSSILWVVP
jgi:hypothetical protein